MNKYITTSLQNYKMYLVKKFYYKNKKDKIIFGFI